MTTDTQALIERLSTLRAEMELRFTGSFAENAANTLCAAISALTEADAKLAKAREDAARYHWLRDHSCPPHNFYISVPDEFHGVRYSSAEVDAYIDEARACLAELGEG